MTTFALTARQFRYENKSFWRNPAAAFFTFVFPLMFLVIFTTIFAEGNALLPVGPSVNSATYYTASILAFGVITAAYVNVAMQMTFARDEGILKRIRGTPLPGWAYIVGKVVHAIFVQVLLIIVTLTFGVIVYDVQLPTDTFLPFVVTMLVGAGSFAALAIAITALIPNADAAPAIVNASVLPLEFASGIFIPTEQVTSWLTDLAEFFPIKHFLDATFASYLGSSEGAWQTQDLLIVAAWGVFGVVMAIRFFSWEPRR